MRRPLAAVLAALACASLASAVDKDPGPSDDFVKAACDSGLLVRGGADKPEAAADADAAADAFPDLAGDDAPADDGGKDGKKGDKPKPKPKKQKARLLRPKAADKDKCPDRMRAFYADPRSRGLDAVLAPRDVPPEEIRSRADDVFAAMSPSSKKGERLSDLAAMGREDLAHRAAFADKLFENAGPLASADFTALTAKAGGVWQGISAADRATKTAALFGTSAAPGETGGTPDPKQAPPPAAAEPKPLPPMSPPPPKRGLDQASVPDTRRVPPAASAWTGADNETPSQYGYLRQKFNDYYAAARDVYNGRPITTEMGWAPGVVNPFHNTTPAQLTGAPGVETMLQAGRPGQSRECARGHDPDYACWGTKDMVAILDSMGRKYDAYFKNIGGGARIRIGDISKRGGGYLSGHVSHQRGVDVDLRFVGDRGGFNVQANSMVIAALMLSVPNFRHIPGQEMILVDQSLHGAVGHGLDKLVAEGVITADEAARGKGALTHWPNHRDHFHVRIKLGDAVVAAQSPGPTPPGDVDSD